MSSLRSLLLVSAVFQETSEGVVEIINYSNTWALLFYICIANSEKSFPEDGVVNSVHLLTKTHFAQRSCSCITGYHKILNISGVMFHFEE